MHERKHRVIKRFAQDINNTAQYSKSVLSECIINQLYEVADPGQFNLSMHLIKPVDPPKGLKQIVQQQLGATGLTIHTSIHARLGGLVRISKTDVVMLKSADGSDTFGIGQAWCLMHIGAIGHAALVSIWSLRAHQPDLGTSTWDMQDNPVLVPMGGILGPALWTESTPGIAQVISLFEFRGYVPF